MTKQIIRTLAPALKSTLSSPIASEQFSAIVDELDERLGYELITTPQAGFYREAFLASRFAKYRHADFVWLGEDPPDFYLRINGATYSYEAVEVVRPGRRRNLEIETVYTQGPQTEDVSTWLTPDEILALLRDAVAKKDHKGYAGVDGLFVYLNTGWINSTLSIRDAIADLLLRSVGMEMTVTSFKEVWVACETNVVRAV